MNDLCALTQSWICLLPLVVEACLDGKAGDGEATGGQGAVSKVRVDNPVWCLHPDLSVDAHHRSGPEVKRLVRERCADYQVRVPLKKIMIYYFLRPKNLSYVAQQ